MARWLILLRRSGNSAIDGAAERLYSTLYEDEDSRVCRDISDEACRVVPGNFFKNVLSQALTKLGDALSNPRTTLPWMLTALQAPGWVASLLVPIRESGSMLPQLAIGAWMRRLPRRKWCYVGGAVEQALAAPFLVVLANQRAESSLAYFLLAQGLSALLSGPAWGAFADRSSRRVLIVAGTGAGLLGVGVFLADRLAPGLAATAWFLPGAFFVLALLHDGVRLGRKTYVVDLAGGNKRTDYVAVGNTLIGVLLLVVGAVTAVIAQFSAAGAILALSLAAFVAVWLSLGLPEVQAR